jgi:hypothetical protein
LAQFEEWEAPVIPREVALRIDAALARESAARTETAGADAPSKAAPSKTAARSGGRRRLSGHGLGWALASLVLVAGGVGLGLKVASSTSTSTNSASSSGVAGSGSAGTRPYAGPNRANSSAGGTYGELSTAPAGSELAQWAKQILASREPLAAQMSAASCAADPAFTGRQQLATADGDYKGTPSTLVVYANPSDPSFVLAVAYAFPCTATNRPVLDRALVAK